MYRVSTVALTQTRVSSPSCCNRSRCTPKPALRRPRPQRQCGRNDSYPYGSLLLLLEMIRAQLLHRAICPSEKQSRADHAAEIIKFTRFDKSLGNHALTTDTQNAGADEP